MKLSVTKNINIFFILFLILIIPVIYSCAGMAASAEEYYSIGMAYFDLGKFDDAQRWLIRARQADRTFSASQYNLGRIAFEQKRYEDAAKYFEGILKNDTDNVISLRAAAYTRIMLGDIETAQIHYSRLLELIPDSADDGYNHALVLFVMEKYDEAEKVMEKYPFAMQKNKDIQLLFARCQAKQNKVEAIASYTDWLAVNSDYKARYEYAQVLEYHEFYARALEEFRKSLNEATATSENPSQLDINFAIVKVLLIADGESEEGITELKSIVEKGYKNITAIEELIDNPLIKSSNKPKLQEIADNIKKAIAEAEKEAAEREKEEKAAKKQSPEQAARNAAVRQKIEEIINLEDELESEQETDLNSSTETP